MSDENQPPNTPAGWYPHPTMANTQGYWDGEKWTGQVAPVAGETPERAEVTQMQSLVLKLLLFAGAAAVVLFAIRLIDNVMNG